MGNPFLTTTSPIQTTSWREAELVAVAPELRKHYMKRWIVNQKLTRFRVDKPGTKDLDRRIQRPNPHWAF